MTRTRFERFLPVSGILAGVMYAVAVAATVKRPTLDSKHPQPYVDWVINHQPELVVSGVAGAFFAFFMLMFAAQLRSSIRAGEAGESTYSSVAWAGSIVVAVSITAMSLLAMAMSEADAASIKTLAYLEDFSWMPWAAASGAMMLGVGLGALRTLALPRWLAVLTAALGVLSVTGPTGVAVFLVTPFWLVAVAVVLLRRQAIADPPTAGVRAGALQASVS